MSTVVVAGALANKPRNGGEAWVRLSWVRALEQVGCTVYLVEELDSRTCVDDTGARADVEDSVNLAFFRDVVAEFGLSERAALLVDDGRSYGALAQDIAGVGDDSDLLLNISGNLRRPDILKRFPCRAYLDIDPGFTQLWHASGSHDLGLADHDLHFTIGENIGTSACDIPTAGIEWTPTRQPVVLGDWPVAGSADPDRFTTLARWRGPYGVVEHRGRPLGLKHHEFRKFIDLPVHVAQTLELALDLDEADRSDRENLTRHGWQVVDARLAAPDPARFRTYIQQSGGEFSVAQGAYVATTSGWFSDRTTRYLASGKPALVQDTGFSRNLPTGRGLVAFSTLEDAVAGARSLASAYAEHSARAREIAEQHFAADVVVPPILARAGVST